MRLWNAIELAAMNGKWWRVLILVSAYASPSNHRPLSRASVFEREGDNLVHRSRQKIRATVGFLVSWIDADSIGQMMLRIEIDGQLRAASDAVVRHLQSYPISGFRGQGVQGSADIMSLEATRRLWSARVDLRRRSFAVGTYTHVLDRWGIVYDQPILLNRRQCADRSRLAVDIPNMPCRTSPRWRSPISACAVGPNSISAGIGTI